MVLSLLPILFRKLYSRIFGDEAEVYEKVLVEYCSHWQANHPPIRT